ncbi:MAG: hypothetical protein KME43_21900 [Myxacorys chilensis ATA2-1-KO14]|jgi:hypothetical protein|nr:hypothetical protein [Myxacorys chilensis ATA2-1-KO14]
MSRKITITLTSDRELGFEAIWRRLPHLSKSHSATIDFLIAHYLNENPDPQIQVQPTAVEDEPSAQTDEDNSLLGEDFF